MLVLYYIRITFFLKNIFMFHGCVPSTAAHLMAQYTSYEHQMTIYWELAKTKACIRQ